MRRLLVVMLLFVSCSGCALWVVKTSPPANDSGWLQLCWEADEDDPSLTLGHFYQLECSANTPMVEFQGWGRRPIRVGITPAAEPYRADIVAAVANWNRQVGFDLFRITKLGWDVTVIGELRGFGLRGGVHFAKEAGHLNAAMYLYADSAPPGDAGTIETVEHELGHILGLEHDEDKHSLMHGTYERQGRWLTAHDRALVKQRYGVAH